MNLLPMDDANSGGRISMLPDASVRAPSYGMVRYRHTPGIVPGPSLDVWRIYAFAGNGEEYGLEETVSDADRARVADTRETDAHGEVTDAADRAVMARLVRLLNENFAALGFAPVTRRARA